MNSFNRESQSKSVSNSTCLLSVSRNKAKKTCIRKGNKTDISVNYGLTLFKYFQTQVADACNKAFTNTGPIILKSITSANPTIEWLVTIARTPKFLKKDKFQLFSRAHYKSWLDTAVDGRKSKHIRWPRKKNPTSKKLWEGTRIVTTNLDAVDWEKINTHMNKIYAKNLTNFHSL
ncbi:uncharacterized protein VP01_3609g2 [Puccinia sorghi]|uniref:Uncharacterized protein n=1 Tax=Puccinia sorghi TaxID=27349 RepID=A0A0L6UV04_9BASI|nr:uncharacterized protein VP01_3609g2 [Puccinia sorghi]